MIETRYLRLVETIARVGTLKRAAEELFVTQSALSHQLRQLEEQLGISIFHRVNSQLQFTAAGQEFCDASRTILEQLNQLEGRMRSMRTEQLAHYVHGFSDAEMQRLSDQATSISGFLHFDSKWPEGAAVLEVGCGSGAQTRIIAANNPATRFVAVDLSDAALEVARREVDSPNVSFQRADMFQLPFADGAFEHVFGCFVLEHLTEPDRALRELRRVLKPDGTLTVIEGDHGSTYFYPDGAHARRAVEAQVRLQALNGGDANIGRSLQPLLTNGGFAEVTVSPRQIYVDDTKPDLKKGFIENTFTAMIRGIADAAQAHRIISRSDIKRGVQELMRTAEPGGTFCYTFFKAVGRVTAAEH